MSRVVALVDNSPVTPAVVRTATAVSTLLGAELEVVHVEDPVERRLVDELDAIDVLCGVLGSRSMLSKSHRVGHVAEYLLDHAAVPLVFVPPDAPDFTPGDHPTILVPHDDTDATGDALEPMVGLLAEAGASFVVLHVFDDRSVPIAVSSHDLDSIADEFLLRHRGGHPQRCELRIGHAGSQIVDVARAGDVDAILVVWRQETGPGRAEVIRHLVRESGVPLIVVPSVEAPISS